MPSTASCREPHALPIPQNLSMKEAAAIPETFFTVWHNVFERGAQERRDPFSSCMVARRVSAPPQSNAGKGFSAPPSSPRRARAEKCEAARKLGADLAINYKTEDFVAAAKDFNRRRRRQRDP